MWEDWIELESGARPRRQSPVRARNKHAMAFLLTDRVTAVLGNAALLAGMYGLLHYEAWRIAAKFRAESGEVPKASAALGSSGQSTAPSVPIIFLTPWLQVPLKVPLALSGSFLLSVGLKTVAYPQTVPVNNLLGVDEKLSYAAGIALFFGSAYLHYIRCF